MYLTFSTNTPVKPKKSMYRCTKQKTKFYARPVVGQICDNSTSLLHRMS